MIHPPRHLMTRGRLALALVGVLGISACSLDFNGQPTEYKLSPATFEVLAVDDQARASLELELARLFGTQDLPHIDSDPASLTTGAQLYEAHCLHCHGNEGGGDGVTSKSINPVPRDFRQGIFKYDNIAEGGRPELSDLERVIRAGINGTGMPSMQGLSADEVAELARYVRYIAVRGEVEVWAVEEYEPGSPITQAMVQEAYEEVRDVWFGAERTRCVAPTDIPAATDATIRKGFALFHDPAGANCAGCHGIGGRERGPAAWNTTPDSPEDKVALLRDDWGHDSIPRVLDSEIYRHGADPKTLFERIYLGIDGTPMAGIGEVLGADGKRQFSESGLWSLVHYVTALNTGSAEELTRALESEFRNKQ